jgi:hypothetical protein
VECVYVALHLGFLQLGSRVIRQANCADLALGLEVQHGLPVVLERRAIFGWPMHLVQVDALNPEPPQ